MLFVENTQTVCTVHTYMYMYSIYMYSVYVQFFIQSLQNIYIVHALHVFFRSTGIILEGFPSQGDELRFLCSKGFFPDSVCVLEVNPHTCTCRQCFPQSVLSAFFNALTSTNGSYTH